MVKYLIMIWWQALPMILVSQAISEYAYDSNGRIIQANLPNCIKQRYTYDKDGNRITTQKSQILVTSTVLDNYCYGYNQGSISLQPPPSISYSFNWSNNNTGANIHNLGAGTYVVTITDASSNNSCIKTYTVKAPPSIVLPLVTTSATCYGSTNGSVRIDTINFQISSYLFQWPDGSSGKAMDNLGAGNYTLVVTDTSTGCIQNMPFVVTQPSSVIIDTVNSHISCYGANDGYAAVIVSGSAGNYSFLWSNGSTANSASNLSPGSASVLINNIQSGCSETVYFEITEPTDVFTQVASINPSCDSLLNGSISVVTNGGSAPYKYSFDNGAYLTQSSYTGLGSGIYTIVTRDAKFCYDTIAIVVPEVNCNTAVLGQTVGYLFNVYPSPNGGRFLAEINTPGRGWAMIKVYSAMGQEVYNMQQTVSVGETIIPINIENLSAGLYTIHLSVDSVSFVRSVQVIK